MGAPITWLPPRLCRLLLPLGVFLLLLLLASRRLSELSLSACLGGQLPCPWSREMPPEEEAEEKQGPPFASIATPPGALRPKTPPALLQDRSFDIMQLQRAFTASLSPGGDVLIQEYLRGWRQLVKLMEMLGAAFGLISQETQSKIAIMQQHQEGRHGRHYHTLQSMVTFELASGLVGFQSLPPSQLPSGCRTLLRLHRALKWLELFLHKLGTRRKGEKPSQLCAEAYQEALAPYHSWWVRQVAGLAFLALPSHQELLRIICARQEGQERWHLLLDTVSSLRQVYNVTQGIYAAQRMLELP